MEVRICLLFVISIITLYGQHGTLIIFSLSPADLTPCVYNITGVAILHWKPNHLNTTRQTRFGFIYLP